MSIEALRSPTFSSMSSLVLPAPAFSRKDSVTSHRDFDLSFDINFGELEPLILVSTTDLRSRDVDIETNICGFGSFLGLTLVDSFDLATCPRHVRKETHVPKRCELCRKVRGRLHGMKMQVKATAKNVVELMSALGDERIYEEMETKKAESEGSSVGMSPWDALEKATWEERERDCWLGWCVSQ